MQKVGLEDLSFSGFLEDEVTPFLCMLRKLDTKMHKASVLSCALQLLQVWAVSVP